MDSEKSAIQNLTRILNQPSVNPGLRLWLIAKIADLAAR